jgi:hypothetical protein
LCLIASLERRVCVLRWHLAVRGNRKKEKFAEICCKRKRDDKSQQIEFNDEEGDIGTAGAGQWMYADGPLAGHELSFHVGISLPFDICR